ISPAALSSVFGALNVHLLANGILSNWDRTLLSPGRKINHQARREENGCIAGRRHHRGGWFRPGDNFRQTRSRPIAAAYRATGTRAAQTGQLQARPAPRLAIRPGDAS